MGFGSVIFDWFNTINYYLMLPFVFFYFVYLQYELFQETN